MIIKFVTTHNPSPYKKPSKKQEPVKRSDYVQYLFDKGAGWNGQGTNRADTKGLQLDAKRDKETKTAHGL